MFPVALRMANVYTLVQNLLKLCVNGVRVVNFATSKNLTVKSTMFPHRNIHKFTWTSPDGWTHNQID
jgi:hypothetical protein